MRKYLGAIVLLFLVCAVLPAWDNLSLDLQLDLATISRARAPELRFRTVVFTFDQSRYARSVGIAFDFEDFQSIHPYKRNDKGVFVLPYEVPEGTITYRIVVDGLWMPDPVNPDRVTDGMGNVLSTLDIHLPAIRTYISPEVDLSGNVVFTVKHEPGKRIYLSGDFNNWEPFMFKLTEVSSGLYVFKTIFPPGDYEYCYIAGGARILDPLNPNVGTDSHGYLASRFAVP